MFMRCWLIKQHKQKKKYLHKQHSGILAKFDVAGFKYICCHNEDTTSKKAETIRKKMRKTKSAAAKKVDEISLKVKDKAWKAANVLKEE